MSETKPVYEIPGEVLDGAILEQMNAIHEEFSNSRKEGEFTIQEYADAVNTTYDKAKKELQRALEARRVERRKCGHISYYKMKTQNGK